MVYLISGLPDFSELLELHNLFLRSARVVDDRNLDVPEVVIAVLANLAIVALSRTGSERRAPPGKAPGTPGGLLLLCRRSTGTFAITEGGSVSPPRVASRP